MAPRPYQSSGVPSAGPSFQISASETQHLVVFFLEGGWAGEQYLLLACGERCQDFPHRGIAGVNARELQTRRKWRSEQGHSRELTNIAP